MKTYHHAAAILLTRIADAGWPVNGRRFQAALRRALGVA